MAASHAARLRKMKGNSQSESAPSSDSTTMVNGVDISEELELTMYLLGDPQPDAELVYEEVNKKRKKDLNTTLKVKYIPWADLEKNTLCCSHPGKNST